MARYVVRRVLVAVSTLIAVSLLTFGLFFVVPTNPAALQCGKQCNQAQIAQISRNLGTDRPVAEQYLTYVRGVVTGRTIGEGETAVDCPAPCLGYSFRTFEPVTDIVARTLPITLSIVFGGAILWVTLGVLLGAASALHRGTTVDRAAIGFSLAGASTQIYFVGLILQIIFVWGLHWLPNPAYTSPLDDPFAWAGGMLLPWITLGLLHSAIYARLTRAQLLETLNEDFVRTARAKGLPKRTVYLRHTLRAGIAPVVTIAGLEIGVALGGAVITETVFGLPGLGFTAVTAAKQLNLPVVMATVLIAAFFIVVASVIVDLLYAVIDPRVRLG